MDTSAAESAGTVCITFKDAPKVKFNLRLVSTPETTYKDWTVLSGEPVYFGEPIAAVAAETEEEAQRALELIRVEYEVLDSVLDASEAVKPGSPAVHEEILLKEKELTVENNIACKLEFADGDVERGYKEADVVLERQYVTNRRYHAQLETKSVVCKPDPDGGVTLWSTTQTIHNSRILIHDVFGIPMHKINVKKVALGGSFGSSIHTNISTLIAVALALKARRPVKISLTREEDMHDHSSFQMIFRIKAGVKKDGTLTAGELEMLMDIGSHQIQAYPLLGCVFGWWASFYRWRNLRYVGKAVYTNKVPSCAMRGYGNPQTSWMVETFMDEMAEALGMDPIELKMKNYIGLGEVFWGQGPTVKSVIRSCGVEEILVKGAGMIGWKNRHKPGQGDSVLKRGIGLARGFHTSSAGAPLSGSVIDYSGATVKLNEDGTVDVVTALMDQGGGAYQAIAKIVAEELGVPAENVGMVQADTQTTVYDVCTHASRGIYAGGGAALNAAKQVKEKLLSYAARILEVNQDAMKIKPDTTLGQGVIYVEGFPGKRITVGEVVAHAWTKNWGSIAATVSYRPTAGPPHFTTFFVEVEVDTETGMVTPVRVVAGADIGTVVNPELAAGQIQGGFAMGLSMTLLEDTPYDQRTGDLANKGMLVDYKLPTSRDVPPLDNFEVFFADTYEPTGPFGAKGLGEGSYNPVAGAIANAIYNAIGIRFYQLPITPERILAALNERRVRKEEKAIATSQVGPP
jgi:xanthine dehydrogenase molybdenum-binding subunit